MRRAASLLLACVLALSAFPARAVEIAFTGDFVQGGLVIGSTVPNAKVVVDGKPVRVSPKGDFLIGFGRDAKGSAEIRVTTPDGISEVRRIAIADRDFPVQRIDGLPPKQVTPDPETLKRIRAEGALIAAARKLDTAAPYFRSGFVWPAKGRVSGVFGSQRILNGEPRAPHSGTDIAAPAGTPVLATADGVVALVHPNMFFTGKTVMIDHGHGLMSVYGHMREILVKKGDVVRRGQPIGKVGSSGRATGAHLHWGISLFATRLDPALLVPAPDATP